MDLLKKASFKKKKVAGTNTVAFDDVEFDEMAELSKDGQKREIKGLKKGRSYYRLFFHCRDLNTEFLERCDPMVVLFIKRPDNMFCEIGRTEAIINDHNPTFTRSIIINRVVIEELTKVEGFFGTELSKSLRFVVCSAPKTKYLELKPEAMDYTTLIGLSDWSISELSNSPTLTLMKEISIGPRKQGELYVIAEDVDEISNDVELTLSVVAANLPRLDQLSNSDPFFVVHRPVGINGRLHAIYQSEYKNNTLSPYWDPIKCSLDHFCNGDYDTNLIIELFDWDSSSKKQSMGKVRVQVKDLFQENVKFEIEHKKFEGGQLYVLEKVLTYTGEGTTLDGQPLTGEEVEEVILSFSRQKKEAKEKRAAIRPKVPIVDLDCCVIS